ncbi:hypothetical protein [Tropicibacter oceani]|uniref:Uncharacterized protein n=1 Tax=Tropicibacter oceani TaxID=3058420 RepID=A0ABY8QJP5_9RHOB|nr:hypothetical protein [Tropicibacter oceani]WGW04856.1 hypothetical protein QF118_04705 [Tropicibacter oceani]
MSAKFITGVLAVAATIAAFSALPARADNSEKIAKVVAGVATLYIAGRLIEELADNKVTQVHGPGGRNGYDGRRYGGNDGRYGDRGGRWDKPRHRKTVPAHCVRRVQMRHTNYVLSSYCLRQSHVSLRQLPQRCQVNWRTNRGPRSGYALSCLKRNGYQIARSR